MDGLSAVPYDKGQWFLRWLEESYGREKFDPFIRAWFDSHAFQSVNTDQFLAFLQSELLDKNPGVVTLEQVQAWVEKPGIPAFAKAAESAKFKAVDALIARFNAGSAKAADVPGAQYTTQEWLRLLHGLNAKSQSIETMAALDQAFKLTGYGNNEVAHVWYLMAIANGYSPANAAMERYLVEIGRRKLIVPLYKALSEKDRARAQAIYAKARPGYHPIAQSSLDEMLK